MSANATDRTPLDDPLMAAVRGTLDAVEAAVAAEPASTPPWEEIQHGMRRARRDRRRTTAIRFGAGLLAMSTAAAVAVIGVVPYPASAPTVAVPGSAGKSALDNGRTEGSLANDDEWLAALREQVAAGATWPESGGEFWAPPAAQDVSVIYAGDIGSYRAALVEGDWHRGPVTLRKQVWFEASAGSMADRMRKAEDSAPADLAVNVLVPADIVESIATTAVVVVSATPVVVNVENPPSIHDQGGVFLWPKKNHTVVGSYSVAVPESGVAALSIAGHPEFDQYFRSREAPPTISSQAPARGGAVEPGDSIRDFAADTWQVARQPIGKGSDFRLLAAESPERPQTNGPVRAIVGLVTLPDGARVLSGGEIHDGERSVRLNAGRLLAAGDDTTNLSIAWRKPAEPGQSDPGWTAAMGPVGTARVQWIHRGGQISNQAAQNTIAGTDHDDVTSVRFLNADGAVLSTANVLEPIAVGGVLPEVEVGVGVTP
jgi:hypothetical protein